MASGQIRTLDTNFTASVNSNDPVIRSELIALASGRSIKYPCRAAILATDFTFSSFNATTGVLTTTANFTSADGVTFAVGDRLLLWTLSGGNAPYNGIFTVTSLTGSTQLTRTADANTAGTGNNTDLSAGTQVDVFDGVTYKRTQWLLGVPSVGAETITLNTSNINFYDITPVVPAAVNFSDNEVPTGTVNGSNTAFTLAHTPVSGSEKVYLRRLGMYAGVSLDYTITSATITFNAGQVPQSGDLLYVSYRY